MFDLVGAPNPGVAAFKQEFGAASFTYPVANRANSRAASWMRSAYGHLQRFRVRPTAEEAADEVVKEGPTNG
jgi:hypothetical protein